METQTETKLRKKSFTIIEQAIAQVKGFGELYQEFDDKIRISGQSSSTLRNYARKVAQTCMHFGKLPQHISEKELNKYLAQLTRQNEVPSFSNFKFTVYGLRYFFRLQGLNERVVELPSIKHEKKLPVVLNYEECKALFSAPVLLKHRVLLALIYSAGLRVREASRLRLSDIDSGRMMIHIRQSKFDKDRYVPLSPMILEGLRKYCKACRPVDYLFNGSKSSTPLSERGIQWVLREAAKKCKLQKGVSVHSLRHSYATHLLEFGMDIVSIKELLGHGRIETTMIYLHVAQSNRVNLFSPIDRLYEKS
jgi:site-specific recombinase XerD